MPESFNIHLIDACYGIPSGVQMTGATSMRKGF
jgi:hypothetical protein